MPLQSIVAAVQNNEQKQKLVEASPRYDPLKPIPNLIDATAKAPLEKNVSVTPSVSNSTSIINIKKELEAKTFRNASKGEISWEKCKCLKQSAEKSFCIKYHCLCAKSKCPKQCIEC